MTSAYKGGEGEVMLLRLLKLGDDGWLTLTQLVELLKMSQNLLHSSILSAVRLLPAASEK